MGEVTISIPDELIERARAAGLNVSREAAFAIIAELDREAHRQALDAYVAEIDRGLGRHPEPPPRPARAPWEDEPLPDRPARRPDVPPRSGPLPDQD
jgi:Post-segregation antitoxin CcdA